METEIGGGKKGELGFWKDTDKKVKATALLGEVMEEKAGEEVWKFPIFRGRILCHVSVTIQRLCSSVYSG